MPESTLSPSQGLWIWPQLLTGDIIPGKFIAKYVSNVVFILVEKSWPIRAQREIDEARVDYQLSIQSLHLVWIPERENA